VVVKRKSYPETSVYLSETHFLIMNDTFSCPQKHFVMIISLYWKVAHIFLVTFAMTIP